MRWLLALALLALPHTAGAQDAERDYLTAFLEDSLSGAGRKVTITGFEGALSSRATIGRIEIEDDLGVWIKLDDIVLDWSRSSLLSGELTVNELSAATITLERLPQAPADAAVPSAEAAGFSLPDLPVSVEIGSVAAGQVILGPTILGEDVTGRLDASLSLAGGAGDIALVLERTDGKDSRIALEASYSGADAELSLDLAASEAAGGIFSRLLNLPGRPSVDFRVTGAGPPEDFLAEIQLATDGETRLEGPIRIASAEDGAYRFAAQVAGNLAPLFLPEYAAFLGNGVRLDVAGRRWPSGSLQLETLAAEAGALQVKGNATFAPDGLPDRLALDVSLGLPDGTLVLLPTTGPETRLRSARFSLTLDGPSDAGWKAAGTATGLERPDLGIETITFAGSGRIGSQGGRSSLGASLSFSADGVAATEPALAEALGEQLSGRAVLHWTDGEDGLSLPILDLRGSDFAARANLRVEGLSSGLRTSGTVDLAAENLARFAGIAKVPLGGAGTLRLTGAASRLSGAFDLAIDLAGRGLRIGIPQADRLMQGETTVLASVRRDETGTTLRGLQLAAKSLRLTASGELSSAGSRLDGTLSVGSLADLDPEWSGAVQANAGFTGTLADGLITVTGTGRSLAVGQADIDKLIGGTSTLRINLDVVEGKVGLADGAFQGPYLDIKATGQPGTQALRLTGRLSDLGRIVPELPGPVSLTGVVSPVLPAIEMDLRLVGPAGADLVARGRVSADQTDLRLTGSSDAAVLNVLADPAAFSGRIVLDIGVRGPLALQSVSGRVTLSGGRIAYPLRGLALGRTEIVADLSGGRARLAGTADLQTGGRMRVDGTVGLAGPFDALLDITLDAARLRDPELFDTTLDGALRLAGPVLGGALLSGTVTVREAELVVPDSGFASASDLAAIRHVGDGPEVMETRRRAGLGKGGSSGNTAREAGSGPNWALDVLVNAPRRIFLRGRGLDAELGGTVRLGGRLPDIQPSGAIGLIRGRLDLLGKRLDLSQADLVLEGDLVPYLTIIAINETDGVLSQVSIEGPASAPEVTFSSVPELPQEEVLAWLLFGSGLDSISALQAVQLANAVAVLAGRGGSGVVDRLRKSFGFDDLDFSTGDDGTASVSAGKYISRNVYTEVEIDQSGKSRVTLNLDIKPGVTARGTVDSSGQGGIGIFLEKDY